MSRYNRARQYTFDEFVEWLERQLNVPKKETYKVMRGNWNRTEEYIQRYRKYELIPESRQVTQITAPAGQMFTPTADQRTTVYETYFRLESDDAYPVNIALPQEIGDLLASAWKFGPEYKYSSTMVPKGRVAAKTLLKRLREGAGDKDYLEKELSAAYVRRVNDEAEARRRHLQGRKNAIAEAAAVFVRALIKDEETFVQDAETKQDPDRKRYSGENPRRISYGETAFEFDDLTGLVIEQILQHRLNLDEHGNRKTGCSGEMMTEGCYGIGHCKVKSCGRCSEHEQE